MTSYIVPTRNNHCGLSSLLGSILAHTTVIEKPTLFLMDGSNEPVLANNHLARLLTRFNLHYQHFLEPQVNRQRIAGISDFYCKYGGSDPFVLVDDDHVLVANPEKAVSDFAADRIANAYFGICVDILNDKGYPDYAWLAAGNATTHAFPAAHCLKSYPIKDKPEAAANPGFLVTTADKSLDLLRALHDQFQNAPAVADDAWACSLATPPLMHTALQAMHVGNNNNWWKNQSIKHTAVRLAHSLIVGRQEQKP